MTGPTELSGEAAEEARRPATVWSARGRVVGGALVVAVGIGLAASPLRAWAIALIDGLGSAGPLGAVVYASVYVTATVMLLPASVLTLGAGWAYGPLWGTLLVSPVSVLGATLSFWIARTFGRGAVAKRLARDPRFVAVDEAVGRGGLKVVLLLRLSPVFPFSLMNYALGLSSVRPRDFVLGSWLGMLPATIVYVYVGSVVTSAMELGKGDLSRGGDARSALYWVGLLASIAATVLLSRLARRALRSTMELSR